MAQAYIFGQFDHDYTSNGTPLLATECTVKCAAGRLYELTLVHPLDSFGKWKSIVNNAIIKATVPGGYVEATRHGMDAVIWKTTRATSMYSKPSAPTVINYARWQANAGYNPGAKVTDPDSSGQLANWQAGPTFDHYSYTHNNAPPRSGRAPWNKIARYTTGSSVVAKLPNNTEFYFVADYNSGWIKAQTYDGQDGYVQKANSQFVRTEASTEIPPRNITQQLFRVYEINVDANAQTITAKARHVSYDYNFNLLQSCKITNQSASNALALIRGAAVTPIDATFATNLTDDDGTYTGDLSWKNPLFSLLDPDAGIVPTFRAKIMRDNWDVFVLRNDEINRGYRLSYGKNITGITWKRNLNGLVTRVVPVAQKADGTPLLLPEIYVDSPIAEIYSEYHIQYLKIDAKVGGSDGEGGTWTEAALQTHMRALANNRFLVDHADSEISEVDIDFVELDKIFGNGAYMPGHFGVGFRDGYPPIYIYDTVSIDYGPIGLDYKMQMSEYEYDSLRERYLKIKLGNIYDYEASTVTGYSLASSCIGINKISQSAIDNIIQQAGGGSSRIWENLTPESGTTTPAEGWTQVLQISLKDGVVRVRGFVETKTGNNIAHIPTAYMPPESSYHFVPCGGSRICRIGIFPSSGMIYCEWVKNLSDGNNYNSNVWVDVELSYTI